MGISMFHSCEGTRYVPASVNPDPKRFVVLSHFVCGRALVMLVRYPNCTTFEGRKILVYLDASTPEAVIDRNAGELDPHFSDDGHGPIARFEPTPAGVELARMFTETLAKT